MVLQTRKMTHLLKGDNHIKLEGYFFLTFHANVKKFHNFNVNNRIYKRYMIQEILLYIFIHLVQKAI